MPTPFIMPKFDMDQEKATIISWLKHEGDAIQFDETILTVETDKVAIDVPAPASGILANILYKDGDVVPVTKVIAYILKQGESIADLPKSDGTPPPAPELASDKQMIPASSKIAVNATPVAVRMALEEGIDLARVQASGNKITREDVQNYLEEQKQSVTRVAVPATPAARRVARETGIPLETVAGSGPRGRVQSADVAAQIKSASKSNVTSGSREADVVPLTSIRRTIAERMQRSFQESPHIALTVEVDMSAMDAMRKRFNAQAEQLGHPKITVTALIVKVVAWALTRHPYINASLINDSIHLWKDVNIGVATAVQDGLIVPVIKSADQLSVSEINVTLGDLAEKARENKLILDDVQGGTFTISNLGMFGILQFRAVINPPESAILAVGSVVRRPIVVDEQDHVEVRPMLSLTLSADHRVIDGVIAARFLSDIVAGLKSPSLLLY